LNPKKVLALFVSTSITRRLTLLYALSAFVLLFFSALFLDWVLTDDMERGDNQFLVSEIQNLRVLLREHPQNINLWREEVERETLASASAFIKYYVRILSEAGETLIQTPGMDQVVKPSSFPAPAKSFNPEEKGIKQRAHDGRPLLLMSAAVEPHRFETKKKLIQIALDMSHENAIVADYRRKVTIVIIAGVLFSAIIGFLITSEGLRPLKKITRVVRGIGPDQLHARVGATGWPGEITILADSFDKMLERLENTFATLSQFSADMAHELRTPINNLRGEAEVALYKARTVEEYRQVLESALEEYGRLSRMIENLLFLAHAESRDTLARRSLINAQKEIESLIEYYDALAEEKGIRVTCDGSALLQADPVLFRQALSNILSNALQYTPEKGQIAIAIKKFDDRSVQIEIRDTGIGIDPEHLPKIFNRFYRTEQARAFHPQGTGLGFSIVKSIVDLHGGTVKVQSEPGKGTCVTFTFGA
jgi:two-component system, OmpR family, heavy metal sensor histidine kinase CusS